ncbi:MAG TPA: hypothetical protein VGA55_08015 [Bacteroidota bacterium]
MNTLTPPALLFALILLNLPFAQDPSGSARRDSIFGIWWSPDMEQSAAFLINDSTIYYPDMFVEYRYEINNDTLFVHRDDGIAASRIVRVTPDTLILSSWGQDQLYTRTEPKPRK